MVEFLVIGSDEQLIGLDYPNEGKIICNIWPAVLYTFTKISDVAKDVAKKLNVECQENIGISDYPLVKCNISLRDGIYHLPFDQHAHATVDTSNTFGLI